MDSVDSVCVYRYIVPHHAADFATWGPASNDQFAPITYNV